MVKHSPTAVPGTDLPPRDAAAERAEVALAVVPALLAVAALTAGITINRGFYLPAAMLVMVGSLVFALAACSPPLRRRLLPPRIPTLLLAALAVALSGLAYLIDGMLYTEVRWAATFLHAARGLGFLSVVGLCLQTCRPGGSAHGLTWWVALVFLAGGLVRVSAVLAAPDPVIDVYVWLRDAPEALLDGRDPYTTEYLNVYRTARAEEYNIQPYGPSQWRLPAYPPLPILVALPFRAVGLDARFANVLCDLVAAWALFRAGSSRGRAAVGALAAGAYLHFPQVPFMIEQAWYEPMLAACLGTGLLLAERGRFAGYVLLGLGLTAKQYGVALVVPFLKAQWRHRKAFLLGILVAAGLVIGPFFLWDPRAFLDVVLFLHFRRGVQFDSLTLYTAAYDLWNVQLPGGVLLIPAAAMIGWVTWHTPRGVRSAFAAGTALLVFCLCHTQGYFNYFYLCGYLFLLGIVGWMSEAGGDG